MHIVLALIRKISNEVCSSVMGSFKCYYTLSCPSMCVYVDQFPLKCKLILVQGMFSMMD